MNAFGQNDMSKVSDTFLKKLTLTRLQFEALLLEVLGEGKKTLEMFLKGG